MSVSAPLAAIRAQHPLLHCISNIVSANDCANLALAIGASPIMAQPTPNPFSTYSLISFPVGM